MKSTLLVALALAFATSAHAWVIDEDGHGHPLYWKSSDMPVGYYLVRSNVPGGAEGESAVHDAFAEWDAASDNVEYEFRGFLSEGTHGYDGRNVVYWIDENWPFDRSLAAVTLRYYSTSDGHLLDSDIVFNGDSRSWSTDGVDGYDVGNSATHEVGHFGGLGHSDEADATMYSRTGATETRKRTLAEDDLAGFEALYGGTRTIARSNEAADPASGSSASGASADGGGGGGGCSVGATGGTGNLLLPLTILALLLIRARRPRRTLR